VSTKTIRKNLHELGIFSRVAAVRENRLKWCLDRRDWSVRQWKNVIWSDEFRFKIFRSDGPSRVWRGNGKCYNIRPSVKHGGDGIIVWGGFLERDWGL